MKERYIRAMAGLHWFCIFVSSACLAILVIIVPWGVFTRYVLGFGSKWPEPMAVLLMIIFSFFSAAACYRDNLHIAVMAIPDMMPGQARTLMGWTAEIGMIVTNLFVVIWGYELVEGMMHQVLAEFPMVPVGLTYLPVPIGGAITTLFIIERMWTGAFFAAIDEATVGRGTTTE